MTVDNPSLAGHVLLEIFDDDVGKDDLLGVLGIPTLDILRGGSMTRFVLDLKKDVKSNCLDSHHKFLDKFVVGGLNGSTNNSE